MPLRIASFDIECYSHDGNFLKLRLRDKIIQIGTTYTYLGESILIGNILLVGETSKIDGAIVEWYDDEEMVEAWKKKL